MSRTHVRLLSSLLVLTALVSLALGNGVLPVTIPSLFADSGTPPVPVVDDFNAGDPIGSPQPLVQSVFWGDAPATATATATAVAGTTLTRPNRVHTNDIPPTPLPCPGQTLHCIKHVFIVMMENQSFDRMFGAYHNPMGTPVANMPTRAPGTPGAGYPGACIPDPRSTLIAGHPATFGCSYALAVPFYTPTATATGGPYTPAPTPTFTAAQLTFILNQDSVDNPHSAADGQLDIAGVTPVGGGAATPMTGFVVSAFNDCLSSRYYANNNPACAFSSLRDTATPSNTPPVPFTSTPLGQATATPTATPTFAPFDVMRYLTAQDVPYYWTYANYYTLQDHMFEPVQSYSLPAHLYMVSNWSASCPLYGVNEPVSTVTPQPTDTPNALSTIAPVTQVPNGGACYSDPAGPTSIQDYAPFGAVPQPQPNRTWTDLTYLLDNHYTLELNGTPVATTTPAACLVTTPQAVPTAYGYVNDAGTVVPVATQSGASCVSNPVSWGYYYADNTLPDCTSTYPIPTEAVYPNYIGDHNCTEANQPISGTPEFWNPLQFFTDVSDDNHTGNLRQHMSLATAVAKEAAGISGSVPQVSWIVPGISFSDHPSAYAGANSPATNLYSGQNFLAQVVNLIQGVPSLWQSSAIFVAWDDWGGYYDHLTPPTIDNSGYGIRVPGLVISPWVKRCSVDSTPTSFDAYSRFIEDDFLDGQALDPRTDGRPDPRLTPWATATPWLRPPPTATPTLQPGQPTLTPAPTNTPLPIRETVAPSLESDFDFKAGQDAVPTVALSTPLALGSLPQTPAPSNCTNQ